ncbi:MAG: cyclic pyranopterin monophosphate synthase MoaC [Candidatus Magnetomorum sp.]|nr:cyclic pyranopterin monophosphate synthase MoaC [Candidatus Magnetomorum sp.]
MPENHSLTHLDKQGAVRMVDVSNKPITTRTAIAQCVVRMSPDAFQIIMQDTGKKGNVIETARIAGIMAAKKTSELIPLCHPLTLTQVQIDFFPSKDNQSISIQSMVKIDAKTGVEMEAMTAVSVAALTIYDMCKAVDKSMVITDICLLKKTGGKSGVYQRESI